ncbi:N-acetyltransferase [Candidatus Woesearchaeota archaeon]|nr:N-acetyltransferase [Candidatus Woesearchaeota archaeon]
MIHNTATIDSGAQIGEGTDVWHYSHVRETSKIGNKCNIGQNCYIDFDVVIGNGVKIQNNVSVWHGVTIADDVFIGPCVTFTNDLYPRAFIWEDSRVETTLIKKGASIGANSTIICGNRIIGEYSMIAAGSVVTKNVPDFGLVRGNPAKLVGFVCKCGHKLNVVREQDNFVIMKCSTNCKYSGEEYKISIIDYEMIK